MTRTTPELVPLYKVPHHTSGRTFDHCTELTVIQYAANWAVGKNVKINIHTESLSSILALKSAISRSEFVNMDKMDIFKAKNLVGLSWVKALVGIQGKELADQQIKLAITAGIDLEIPAPRSFMKRALKTYIINEWSYYWRQYYPAS
ncbi:hypothetical protein AVEN_13036-1 [Araneus ventricosus]|uniref:RNase H type-1 domain-containing protein n=1 Tax=Araneus ventricosus TaxID=182803 RepID=A0A4Y2IKA3_ARAVE|nr:hypothetical protein AVEN_13036-1 [Araneus ventricosus]